MPTQKIGCSLHWWFWHFARVSIVSQNKHWWFNKGHNDFSGQSTSWALCTVETTRGRATVEAYIIVHLCLMAVGPMWLLSQLHTCRESYIYDVEWCCWGPFLSCEFYVPYVPPCHGVTMAHDTHSSEADNNNLSVCHVPPYIDFQIYIYIGRWESSLHVHIHLLLVVVQLTHTSNKYEQFDMIHIYDLLVS